jgi:hypothetical protein
MTSFWFSTCVCLLTVAVITPVSAQTASNQPADAEAPAVPAGPGRLHYGVRFGPSFTTLTSVDAFDDTAAPAAFEPTMNFGGFLQIDLCGALSFQPEVLFVARGQRIRDKDAPSITTAAGEVKLAAADRVMLVRYLEMPLLLRLSKRTHENTSLYLVGGPAFALLRNAVIREVADSGRHEDIDDRVNGGNLSYVVGGGLQHRRWLVDARIVRGIRNIAADPDAAPVKTSALSVLLGARL